MNAVIVSPENENQTKLMLWFMDHAEKHGMKLTVAAVKKAILGGHFTKVGYPEEDQKWIAVFAKFMWDNLVDEHEALHKKKQDTTDKNN